MSTPMNLVVDWRLCCGLLTVMTRENRYNRYLAVAARAVRRSLKEGPRLNAERRGQMELKFAKWEVRIKRCSLPSV